VSLITQGEFNQVFGEFNHVIGELNHVFGEFNRVKVSLSGVW
jgi:hypothetical protein